MTCQWPVEEPGGEDRPCARPAQWFTSDLQEFENLCDEHCAEAMTLNDFRRERL